MARPLRSRFVVGLIALAGAVSIAAPAAASYEVRSPFVTDEHGRVVFFHGVNAVWKRPPYYPPSSLYGESEAGSYFDERDARLFRSWGWNSVRLGNLFVGTEPKRDSYDDAYLAKIEAITDMLGEHHITVMIDFHQDMWHEQYEGEGFPDWATTVPPTNCCGFPGNYFTPGVTGAFERLWQNEDDLWKEYTDAWQYVATRFADKENLIGYDVMNEPWPGAQWQSCANPQGCPQFDTQYLQPFMEAVIKSIRTRDERAVIWWDPHVITNSGAANNVGLQQPIADPAQNQGISFHLYCIAGSESTPVRPSEDPSCAQSEPLAVTNQETAAERNSSALFLTEFGATDDLGELKRVTRLMDEHMISWHYWHYGFWKDPTTTGSGYSQAVYEDDLDRFETLKMKKLRLLVRPYPQAVAGTPLKFRFFPRRNDRLFRLVYRADPRIDKATVVYVPNMHYFGCARVRIRAPKSDIAGRAVVKRQRLVVPSAQTRGRVTVTIRSDRGAVIDDAGAVTCSPSPSGS